MLRKNFIFLNVYCTSVADEHDPRGPEGPYQFKDRSVPVLLFKKWNGETINQTLGFSPDPKTAKRRLAQLVESALKKHGKVSPPKALKPLIKSYEKGMKYLAKDNPGAAYREFAKAVKGGKDTKKFREGPPDVALNARTRIDEIVVKALEEIEEAGDVDLDGVETVAKAYRKLLQRYSAIPEIKTRIKAALKALPEK